MMLNLAFGGDSSSDLFDKMLASLLVNTMTPQLADAFTPVLLSNLGQVAALEKEYAVAQGYFEDALTQVRVGQQQNDTAKLELVLPLFTDLFGTLGLTADPQLDALLKGLPELVKSGQRLNTIVGYNSEALVLNNLALVYMAQEQKALARNTFEEALTIYEEKLAAYPGAINVYANLGWLAQQEGADPLALQRYEAAIGLLASVRSVAEGDVSQLRQGNAQMLDSIDLQGILSQQADVYALAANLYLKDDKPIEAFQAIERGRARLFRDMVSTGNARLPATEAALLDDLREAFDLQIQAEISLTQLRVVRPTDNAQIRHLAAHGNFDDVSPLRSAIALASDDENDGILEVREVFGLDLREANLVFLSACETALGEQSLGDEITGLTRAFLYAGTPSIITTLWSVNDAASGALVSAFYEEQETAPSFAAALQSAQLTIMQTEAWADPYYWAAFTLHGDYLGGGERSEVVIDPLIPTATPIIIQSTEVTTPTVPTPPTPTPEPEVQLEIIDNLNVRSGPGTAYERIGQLTAGNEVTIIGSNIDETWWEICCVDGQRGWVINNVNYMRIVESAQ